MPSSVIWDSLRIDPVESYNMRAAIQPNIKHPTPPAVAPRGLR